MPSYLGESIPKLGFGLMRLPHAGEAIDLAQTAAMADLFLDAGFTYFDTSWAYPGSEPAFKAAVAERHPRASYLLASKSPAWRTESRAEARGMLDVTLERTGAGYLDFYLLHNLGGPRTHYFDDYDMWEFAQNAKADGRVRHIGFSLHDNAAALEKILTEHPEMEFVQLQVNYADWENPAIEARKCLEVAAAHGTPVIIMEPVKGGSLAKVPADVEATLRAAEPDATPASWALRFAASLPNVITVLSGMSNLAQMRDNLTTMRSFTALTPTERATIERARAQLDAYRSIPCTQCGYCTEVCPENVAIPGAFEAMNWADMYEDVPAARNRYFWNTDGHHRARASACIACGACEDVCPQHIAIRDELARTATALEE